MLSTDELYRILYEHLGDQGWWPAQSNIEMMLGAILVQNTRWRNASLALEQLKEKTQFDTQQLLALSKEDLEQLIRSSGFYRSKTKTIIALLTWLDKHSFDYHQIKQHYGENLRTELLKIRGIGSETADVLLVYIFDGIEFIPDSYTRRLYAKLGYQHTQTYDMFKRHITLPDYFTNTDANEFHALLDHFGKQYFNNKQTTDYNFLDAYFVK